MIAAIAISFGFGVIAGFAILVVWRSGLEALAKARAIRAELLLIDNRPAKMPQAALWRLQR